jgi:hypothetical protein
MCIANPWIGLLAKYHDRASTSRCATIRSHMVLLQNTCKASWFSQGDELGVRNNFVLTWFTEGCNVMAWEHWAGRGLAWAPRAARDLTWEERVARGLSWDQRAARGLTSVWRIARGVQGALAWVGVEGCKRRCDEPEGCNMPGPHV